MESNQPRRRTAACPPGFTRRWKMRCRSWELGLLASGPTETGRGRPGSRQARKSMPPRPTTRCRWPRV